MVLEPVAVDSFPLPVARSGLPAFLFHRPEKAVLQTTSVLTIPLPLGFPNRNWLQHHSCPLRLGDNLLATVRPAAAAVLFFRRCGHG